MSEVFELFPTPFMRVAKVISPDRVQALRDRFAPEASHANPRSAELTHTTILPPSGDPLLEELEATVLPSLVDFGVHLFGERLTWQIKELWFNVLRHGGRQSVHNHANCFISGVLYLSECHPSANTTPPLTNTAPTIGFGLTFPQPRSASSRQRDINFRCASFDNPPHNTSSAKSPKSVKSISTISKSIYQPIKIVKSINDHSSKLSNPSIKTL